jgi:4-hydroxy-3-methylbut-2-enyl diphosphate reductase
MGYLKESGTVVESIEEAEKLILPATTKKLTYLTQTTLSPSDVEETVDILRKRFPFLEEPSKNDICYATLERQKAVKKLAEQCEIILVIGSQKSSNSNKLKSVAEKAGTTAMLINSVRDIPQNVFDFTGTIGITAGASAPEILVEEVVKALTDAGFTQPTDSTEPS